MPVESSQKKTYFLIFILAGLLIIFYQWVSSPLIVTVTGVGSASAPAQSATVTFTLSSTGNSSQEAIDSLRLKITRVKTSLQGINIRQSDTYESQLTVYPTSAVTPGGDGFQSTINMGIKTENITDLDKLTANLYALGASVVTQPTLAVATPEELDNEAYTLALGSAKKQANAIARKNFKFFKKIVLIEQTQTPSTSSVTTKAGIEEQVDKNLNPDDGVLKINKVLLVSFKMW